MIKIKDRTEFGQLFQALPQIGGWASTEGRKVLVFPPSELLPQQGWLVLVPSIRRSDNLVGEDAEARAFCIAEGYARQRD